MNSESTPLSGLLVGPLTQILNGSVVSGDVTPIVGTRYMNELILEY